MEYLIDITVKLRIMSARGRTRLVSGFVRADISRDKLITLVVDRSEAEMRIHARFLSDFMMGNPAVHKLS